MSSYWNPRAYVPGGSTPRVARAITGLARRKPVIRRPVPRPRAGVVSPSIDPFITRANSLVSGVFNPLFTELGKARALGEQNARAAYGAHATALENAFKASGAQIPAAFDTSIAQSAKVNEAVANRLAGQGAGASQGLAAQLAQISADPGQAARLAQSYQGASNAGFAKDSADLQHLIARRGEAASYQGKLPSIGRLAVNQALERALSEQRGYFAEQEQGLRQSAADRALGLYGDLRSESFQQRAQAEDTRQRILDRQQEEKAAIRALQATALSEAERRQYDAQEAALDRQHDREMAEWEAQLGTQYDTSEPDKVTGPPNQQWITVNGQKVKNPNYVPPSKAGGSTTDNWTTPGSAKRNRVIELALTATINPNNITMLRGTFPNPNQVMVTVMNKINNALKMGGVPANQIWGTQATQLRRSIMQQLVGKKFKGADGGIYEITQDDVDDFTRLRKKGKNTDARGGR